MSDEQERILTAAAREALASEDDRVRARLARQKHFIEHPGVEAIWSRLDEGFEDYPTTGDSHCLIVADPGMGKSQIGERYRDKHAAASLTGKRPVVYVGLISSSARGFLARILEEVKAPYPPSGSADVLYPLVLRVLRNVELRVLILDEFHHAYVGHREERAKLLFVIKQLGNDLKITIVGCGTLDALLALQLDPQLERRFEPLPLGRWRDDKDGWGFLNGLESTLPLPEPSNLSDEDIAAWIFAESEGLTGAIDSMIRRAAVRAIALKRTAIDLPLLKSIHWIRPSRRRKEAEATVKRGRPPLAIGE